MVRDFNDETNCLHKLLLTDTQVSTLHKAFPSGSSFDIKFPKIQLSKMVQFGGFIPLPFPLSIVLNPDKAMADGI